MPVTPEADVRSQPLSKPSPPKKQSKHQSARPPQGSTWPGTLPTVLSKVLRKKQGQVLHSRSCNLPCTHCSQDLTHRPNFYIHCPVQMPLAWAALHLLLGWLPCSPLIHPLLPSPRWLRTHLKEFCGRKQRGTDSGSQPSSTVRSI